MDDLLNQASTTKVPFDGGNVLLITYYFSNTMKKPSVMTSASRMWLLRLANAKVSILSRLNGRSLIIPIPKTIMYIVR